MDIITPLQILPHPKRGTMEIGSERILPIHCELRAGEGASDETPIIVVQGTDGTEDRHGTPINPQGWDFTSFERNPIALWSHGTVENWPAVGTIQKIRGVGGAWDFESLMLVKAWRHLDVNMPAFLWEVYRDFGLGAVSVSFIPKKWEDYESKGIPSFFAEGVRYLEQELTEISFVNVPSNRNALAKGLERYRALGKGDSVARMLGYEVSPIVINPTRETPKPEATIDRVAVRAFISEQPLRCCGCDPYVEEKPSVPVDEAQRAAEVTTLQDLADEAMQLLEVALRGWKTVATERLREYFSGRVYESMWMYDTCARWLSEWYGVEMADVPYFDVADVERSLVGFDPMRAGAVFSKKNLAKIDQIIELATDLRAAANKPTADDVPADETRDMRGHGAFCGDAPADATRCNCDLPRRRVLRLQHMARMAGPFDFASTQVNIEGEVADLIMALGASIPDEALAEKGRETDVHATVKFGIDPSVSSDEVAKIVQAIKPWVSGTMTLGATAMFEADEYEVVFISVESVDLEILNSTISEAVKVTDTHPEYVPHITLAYVKKGEGQKYVGDETLAGTVVSFDAIAFSDTEGNETVIPLAGETPSVDEQKGFRVGIPTIRIKSGTEASEPAAESQPIRVLAQDASSDRGDESPAPARSPFYVTLLSD